MPDITPRQAGDNRRISERRGRRAADRQQQIDPGDRRRPADPFMQRRGLVAELQHLAQHRDASIRFRLRQHVERASGRRRIRVVAVVDHGDAARQPHDLAAVRRRPQRRRACGDVGKRHVELQRDRGRRQDVRQVGAAEQRRRHVGASFRRRDARLHPVHAAVDDVGRTHVRVAIDPERDHASREPRQARDDARIIGVGDEQRRARRALENLRLCVGDRVDRGEEADVRLADVRPHAYVGLGDADERADFPGVIHPQLDDGNLRPPAQRDERQRQPDVVVQVPLVPDHAVPRRQERARDFLRGRLPRAAGNRHDFGARLASDRPRERLEGDRRVIDFDDREALA